MTQAEMVSLFDLIEDKVEGIYFTGEEKYEFLNAAQRSLVEEILQNPERSIDSDKKIDSLVYTIVEKDVTVSPAVNGNNPTHSEIEAALTNPSEVMYILSASREKTLGSGDFVTAKWIRENEKGPFSENTFKASSVDRPWVETDSQELKFTPACAGDAIVSVVRLPIDIGYGTDCELPSSMHEKVVARAISLAMIPTGDQNLLVTQKII